MSPAGLAPSGQWRTVRPLCVLQVLGDAGSLAAVDALVDDVMAAELSASEHSRRLELMRVPSGTRLRGAS